MKLKEEWEIVMMVEMHVLLFCSFVFNIIEASLQRWNQEEHLNKCIFFSNLKYSGTRKSSIITDRTKYGIKTRKAFYKKHSIQVIMKLQEESITSANKIADTPICVATQQQNLL